MENRKTAMDALHERSEERLERRIEQPVMNRHERRRRERIVRVAVRHIKKNSGVLSSRGAQ